MIGTVIDRYELVEEIGRGGMGVVYRARHTALGKTVAIKALAPEVSLDEAARRLVSEATVLASLDSGHIVQVHDLVQVDGRWYVVMEYVDGESLERRIQRGPLAIPEALSIARQLCTALQHVHERGFLHRDIKPGNIMLTAGGQVKLLDLGIFRDLAKAASTYTTLGTPGYMAPEQIEAGPLDARTDLYAVGAVLYEMLAGRPPFQADLAITLAYKQVHEMPAPLSGVPEWLAATIARCLSKDPANRYPTAGTLLRALQEGPEGAHAQPAPVKPSPLTLEQPLPAGSPMLSTVAFAVPSARRTPAVLGALVGIPLLLAALAGLVSLRSRPQIEDQEVTSFVPAVVETAPTPGPRAAPPVPKTKTPKPAAAKPAAPRPGQPPLPPTTAQPAGPERHRSGPAVIPVRSAATPQPQPTPTPAHKGGPGAAAGRLVFAVQGDPHFRIAAVGEDGSDRVDLTAGDHEDRNPVCSPDGRQIAFDRDARIWIMDADGGHQRQIADTGGPDITPAWSPDGRRLAFAGRQDGFSQVWTVEPDGSNLARLTDLAWDCGEPSWSPDGSRIVFISRRDGLYAIDQMTADGNQRWGVGVFHGEVHHPVWSPDGGRVLFTCNEEGRWQVYSLRPGDEIPTNLSHTLSNDAGGCWSTDGRHIVFQSDRDGDRWRLYVMDADGSHQSPLAAAPIDGVEPRWSGAMRPT